MNKLIYQIAPPMCDYREVPRHVWENPPQRKGSETKYTKRILIEATPEQIAEIEAAEVDLKENAA